MTGFARIVTLGCRLNAADSALLYTALEECDYRASETETPDVLIVNTCAVTAEAERKTRQTLRRLRHEYPAARIIAAGCAADADREAMLRSGADLVCGNADKRDLAALLHGETPRRLPCPGRTFKEERLSSFPSAAAPSSRSRRGATTAAATASYRFFAARRVRETSTKCWRSAATRSKRASRS